VTVTLTDSERAYIQGHTLARLATSSLAGEPDVAAVMSIWSEAQRAFVVGGLAMEGTRKYHYAKRNPRFSLVFDDVSFDPGYAPRGVKFTGKVEIRTADDNLNLGTKGVPLLVLHPERKWSWGIEDAAFDNGTFRLRVDDSAVGSLTTEGVT
jgi:PPOX class F420-dependent enzyme/OxyR family protein